MDSIFAHNHRFCAARRRGQDRLLLFLAAAGGALSRTAPARWSAAPARRSRPRRRIQAPRPPRSAALRREIPDQHRICIIAAARRALRPLRAAGLAGQRHRAAAQYGPASAPWAVIPSRIGPNTASPPGAQSSVCGVNAHTVFSVGVHRFLGKVQRRALAAARQRRRIGGQLQRRYGRVLPGRWPPAAPARPDSFHRLLQVSRPGGRGQLGPGIRRQAQPLCGGGKRIHAHAAADIVKIDVAAVLQRRVQRHRPGVGDLQQRGW